MGIGKFKIIAGLVLGVTLSACTPKIMGSSPPLTSLFTDSITPVLLAGSGQLTKVGADYSLAMTSSSSSLRFDGGQAPYNFQVGSCSGGASLNINISGSDISISASGTGTCPVTVSDASKNSLTIRITAAQNAGISLVLDRILQSGCSGTSQTFQVALDTQGVAHLQLQFYNSATPAWVQVSTWAPGNLLAQHLVETPTIAAPFNISLVTQARLFDAVSGTGSTAVPLTLSPCVASPTPGQWTLPMVTGSYATTVVSFGNGKVVNLGGLNRDGSPLVLNTAQLYDDQSGAWSSLDNIPYAAYFISAVALNSTQALVIGGSTGSSYFHNAYILDISQSTGHQWAAVDAFPVSTGFYYSGSLILLNDLRVAAIGGRTNIGALDTIYLFDPLALSGSQWTLAGHLNQTRCDSQLTLMDDGTVLVTGGWDASTTSTGFKSSVEKVKVLANTATSFAMDSMAGVRSFHKAFKLSNGKVIVVGGVPDYTGTPAIGRVELFDLNAISGSQWTTLDSMTTATFDQGAVQLTDGRFAFAAGEVANNNTGTNNMQIFDPTASPGSQWTTGTNILYNSAYNNAVALSGNRMLLIAGLRTDWSTPAISLMVQF